MSRGCGLGVQATNSHVDCSLARVDAALGAYQLQAQQLSPCVRVYLRSAMLVLLCSVRADNAHIVC